MFVYQNRRFDCDFLTSKKLLESGKLGRLIEATISYDIHLLELRENGTAHTEKPKSGGEFNNRGSHIIDQSLVLFGMPDAVFADFATYRNGGTVEDYVDLILYYPDKRAKVREIDVSVQSQDAYIFHGLEGSFFKSRSDMQEERLLAGIKPMKSHWCDEPENEEGRLYYYKGKRKILEKIKTEDGNYYNYFDAVYQTILHGAPSPVTGFDGYRTMLVMDAARESVKDGKIKKIDYSD